MYGSLVLDEEVKIQEAMIIGGLSVRRNST